VGTSNALTLFKEAMEGKHNDMTIVEFKSKLVVSSIRTKAGGPTQAFYVLIVRFLEKTREHDSNNLTLTARFHCAMSGVDNLAEIVSHSVIKTTT
jgi:hypothetical protein